MPACGSVSRYSTIRPLSVRGPLVGRFQPSVPIQHARVDPTVHHVTAVGIAMDVLVQRRGRAGEFADDFLEDVLECHQSLDVAVFVHDQRDAPAVALEVQQLHVERRAFGHEIRFALARQIQQMIAIEVAAHDCARNLLHVQDADDVVEVALADR